MCRRARIDAIRLDQVAKCAPKSEVVHVGQAGKCLTCCQRASGRRAPDTPDTSFLVSLPFARLRTNPRLSPFSRRQRRRTRWVTRVDVCLSAARARERGANHAMSFLGVPELLIDDDLSFLSSALSPTFAPFLSARFARLDLISGLIFLGGSCVLRVLSPLASLG